MHCTHVHAPHIHTHTHTPDNLAGMFAEITLHLHTNGVCDTLHIHVLAMHCNT